MRTGHRDPAVYISHQPLLFKLGQSSTATLLSWRLYDLTPDKVMVDEEKPDAMEI